MSHRQPLKLRRGIRPGRRPLTCHHEAGHALVRWWTGHFFDCVRVFSTEQVARRYRPRTSRGGRGPEVVEGRLEGYSLAPNTPRKVYEDFWARSDDPDLVAKHQHGLRVAVEFCLLELAAGPVAEAVCRHYSIVDVALMGGDRDLGSMRKLRAEWFSEDEAEVVADRTWRLASALVRSPQGWRAITELAAVLKTRGRVSFEQAEPIFERAFGRPRPRFGSWNECWPPTVAQVRAGWMPNAAPRPARDHAAAA